MSKMREAFEKWKGSKTVWDTSLEQVFESGYQAAIADVKAGGAIAWMLHDGEIWNTPVCPYKDERGAPLYKLPEDV